MNAALSFYQLLTTVSFTLLGLWFAVLSLDGRWRQDHARHRATLHTSLCFFLPGEMGLGSVLSGGNSLVWRLFFLLGGLGGAAEAVMFLYAAHGRSVGTERVLRIVGPWPYAAVVVAALVPGPVAGLVPLQIEGLATGLVFLTGMCHLWVTLSATHESFHGPWREPRTEVREPEPPTRRWAP